MSNFSDEFVSLQCPHCAGKVKVTPTQLDESFVESGDTFVYIGAMGTEQIKCEHCGTEFVRKQRVGVAIDGTGTINTCGGAFIGGSVVVNGGNVHGTTIITSDGDVVIRKRR